VLGYTIFAALPFTAFAASTVASPVGVYEGDFEYVLSKNGDEAFINSYIGSSSVVTIPSTLGGYPVTSINHAFKGSSKITSITIPSNVRIPYQAFYDCNNLTSITIGNGITAIGSEVFVGCTSLTSIIIPDSVTTIGEATFQGCTSLTSVTIGNSVTSISTSGYYSAFKNCTSLTAINVVSDNKSYSSEDGVLFNKDKSKLIFYPYAKPGAYTIPYGLNYNFSGCTGLTSVTLPTSVNTIGYYYDYDQYYEGMSFSGCTSLTNVIIPNSVTRISGGAFKGCTSLTSVTIPNSVTNIGVDAFEGCTSLTAINVVSDNKSYSSEDGVLFDKNKTELIQYPLGKVGAYVVPDGVIGIGKSAFETAASLTDITFPNSLKIINARAFWFTSLTEITIPSSVVSAIRAEEEDAYMDNLEPAGPFAYITTLKTIYCYEGSYAQSFAIAYGIPYALLKTKTDNNSGIALIAPETIVPADAQLTVAQVTEETADFALVNTALEEEATQFTVYDITLLQNSTAIQPNGKVTITMPVPQGYDTANLALYHIADDGTKTAIPFTLNAAKTTITFETDHFSFYAIAELEQKTPIDPDPTAPILGDADGDGAVTISDVTEIQKYLALLADFDEAKQLIADADGDGKVTVNDATELQKHLAQLPANKNIEKPMAA
jgi:hypothetical protein